MLKTLALFLKKHRNLLLRIFLFSFTGLIIVYQLPKEYKFSYEYSKGAPWLHENLIAPYDFPIYKLDADLALEKDSIEHISIPYYRKDNSVQKLKVQEYKIKLQNNWETIYLNDSTSKKIAKDSLTFLNKKINLFIINIVENLNSLYSAGILESTQTNDKILANKLYLRVRTGEKANNVLVSKLYYEKTAYVQFQKHIDSLSNSIKYKTLRRKFNRLLQLSPAIDYLKANLYYDELTTEKVKKNMLESISPSLGIVQKGESIVLKGEIITEEKFRKLESYRKEFESYSKIGLNTFLISIAQIIIVGLILSILFLFLYQFRLTQYKNLNIILFLLLLILLETSLTNLFVHTKILHVYLIPYLIFPLLIKSYFDSRTAVFFHILSILLSAFLVANGYEFIIIQTLTGFLAIFSLDNIKKRSQLFRLSFIAFIAYSFIYASFSIIYGETIKSFNWQIFTYFAINSLLLLLAYPLIYIFERIFGFTSELTLIELTDTNNSLLRKLAENAPGTFQHSLQVANLAEEAIVNIRGNSLLVRVGALYHDIGKLHAPEFFTENQVNGYNPHNKINEPESAAIIIKHITEGKKMAQKAKLPNAIIDFIVTHHGTTRTEFFYRNYKSKNPDKNIDEKLFTYPGPRPFSKETAILMMADSIEAASRSLQSYTDQTINELVEKIINYQIERKQFEDAPISFKQISIVKASFKQKLKNIYHTRIAYPEEK